MLPGVKRLLAGIELRQPGLEQGIVGGKLRAAGLEVGTSIIEAGLPLGELPDRKLVARLGGVEFGTADGKFVRERCQLIRAVLPGGQVGGLLGVAGVEFGLPLGKLPDRNPVGFLGLAQGGGFGGQSGGAVGQDGRLVLIFGDAGLAVGCLVRVTCLQGGEFGAARVELGLALGELVGGRLLRRLNLFQCGAARREFGQLTFALLVVLFELVFEPGHFLAAPVDVGLHRGQLAPLLGQVALGLVQLRTVVLQLNLESLRGAAAVVKLASELVQLRLPPFELPQGPAALSFVGLTLRFQLGEPLVKLLLFARQQFAAGLVGVARCLAFDLEEFTVGGQLGNSIGQGRFPLGQIDLQRLELVGLPVFLLLGGSRRLPQGLLFGMRLALGGKLLVGGVQAVAERFQLVLPGGQFGCAPGEIGRLLVVLGLPLRFPRGLGLTLGFEIRPLSPESLFSLIVASRGPQDLRKALPQLADLGDQPLCPAAHLRSRLATGRRRNVWFCKRLVRAAAAGSDDFEFDRAKTQAVAGRQPGVVERPAVEPGVERPATGHHAMFAAEDQAMQRTHAMGPEAQGATRPRAHRAFAAGQRDQLAGARTTANAQTQFALRQAQYRRGVC